MDLESRKLIRRRLKALKEKSEQEHKWEQASKYTALYYDCLVMSESHLTRLVQQLDDMEKSSFGFSKYLELLEDP